MNSLARDQKRTNNQTHMDVIVTECIRCTGEVLFSAKQRADTPAVCETCKPILGDRPSVEYDNVCYFCGGSWIIAKQILCSRCLAEETDTSKVH